MWHGFHFPYGFTFLLQCSHAVNPDNGVMGEGDTLPTRGPEHPVAVGGAVQSSYREAPNSYAPLPSKWQK